jgi:hypothetical protein
MPDEPLPGWDLLQSIDRRVADQGRIIGARLDGMDKAGATVATALALESYIGAI